MALVVRACVNQCAFSISTDPDGSLPKRTLSSLSQRNNSSTRVDSCLNYPDTHTHTHTHMHTHLAP